MPTLVPRAPEIEKPCLPTTTIPDVRGSSPAPYSTDQGSRNWGHAEHGAPETRNSQTPTFPKHCHSPHSAGFTLLYRQPWFRWLAWHSGRGGSRDKNSPRSDRAGVPSLEAAILRWARQQWYELSRHGTEKLTGGGWRVDGQHLGRLVGKERNQASGVR